MENIFIQGNDGCYLRIENFVFADDHVTANAQVHSNWYTARGGFQISKERLPEHLEELRMIDNKEKGNSLLINEYGNFEIEISLNA